MVRFGKKGKLSSRYIRPFEISKKVGLMSYRLALPLSLLGVHPVFLISILMYHKDRDYIIFGIQSYLIKNFHMKNNLMLY